MNSGRRMGAALTALALALALGTGPARGETTGDLYVASAAGILEVVTASASVLSTARLPEKPGPIAIRPDGRELYAVSGGRALVRVDLEEMAVSGQVSLPAVGVALAHPRGPQVAVALPTLRQLGVFDADTGTVDRSPVLPGPVDLLAADPTDGRVVAAAKGESWVAVYDTGSSTVRSARVAGRVTAIALDGRRGTVLVATSGPDSLTGLRISTLAAAWTAPAPPAPSALAVSGAGALIASGRAVWEVGLAGAAPAVAGRPSATVPTARRWAALAGPASALAVSEGGAVVYALEAGRIERFAVGLSGAGAGRAVSLTGSRSPTALVAVPGVRPPLSGPMASAGQAPAGGAPAGGLHSRPPATDTDPAGGVEIGSGVVLVQSVAAGLAILVIGILALRHRDRRAAR